MMIKFRTLISISIIIASFAFLIMLGNWQMQRLAWKEALIARLEQRMQESPKPLPDILQGYEDWEYKRFEVTGIFDNSKELYLFAIAEGKGPGFHIYSPFLLNDGRTVIVNRGWIPETQKLPSSRTNCCVEEQITIIGKVRRSREQGLFVPDNETENNQWYYANLDEMAHYLSIDNYLPFYLDVEPIEGSNITPNGGATRIHLSNNHLGYAITWYGLALSLLAVVAAWMVRRRFHQ